MVIECMENVKSMKHKRIGDRIMSLAEVLTGHKLPRKKSKHAPNSSRNHGLLLCLKCMRRSTNIQFHDMNEDRNGINESPQRTHEVSRSQKQEPEKERAGGERTGAGNPPP
uniref:Uncharacterized protein n=3 Tax=Physcomitrium patens TaxID=3218 RepID=A0A7I4EVU8_PHYPA